MRAPEHVLGFLASDVLRLQIEQEQMAIRAPGDDTQAALDQALGQRLCVVEYLLLVDLEVGLQRFLKGHRLGGYDVHQRTTLRRGKDRRIEHLLMLCA